MRRKFCGTTPRRTRQERCSCAFVPYAPPPHDRHTIGTRQGKTCRAKLSNFRSSSGLSARQPRTSCAVSAVLQSGIGQTSCFRETCQGEENRGRGDSVRGREGENSEQRYGQCFSGRSSLGRTHRREARESTCAAATLSPMKCEEQSKHSLCSQLKMATCLPSARAEMQCQTQTAVGAERCAGSSLAGSTSTVDQCGDSGQMALFYPPFSTSS